MHKIPKKMSMVFIFTLVLSLILTGCISNGPGKNNSKDSPGIGKQKDDLVLVRKQQFVLGTLGEINVYSKTEEEGYQAIALAYERIREIEDLMSASIEDSDIYNINKNAGIKTTEVSPETMKVILEGIDYYDTSKKTFNIGLGSLISLWGIGSDTPRVPTAEEIMEAKNHIDLNQLEISEKDNSVFIKDPKMSLDLGGIAKGYAVDEAMRTLKENGISSGIVNLGGDIFVFGTKNDSSLWKVGVTNPEVGNSGSPMARIIMTDKSIVTSGDYERFFIEDGIKYHHIIDFNTGMPADTGVIGVTIIADTCMHADIIATSALVLGIEEGLQLIESQPNVEGLIITEDREVYVSSGLKKDLEILDKNFKLVN